MEINISQIYSMQPTKFPIRTSRTDGLCQLQTQIPISERQSVHPPEGREITEFGMTESQPKGDT